VLAERAIRRGDWRRGIWTVHVQALVDGRSPYRLLKQDALAVPARARCEGQPRVFCVSAAVPSHVPQLFGPWMKRTNVA
jgi:hypothetical protein